MPNLYNNDLWLEPTFYLIMYDPFHDMCNRMRRQRMRRRIAPYSLHSPLSVLSPFDNMDLEQQLGKKNAINWPKVSDDRVWCFFLLIVVTEID